uniref:Uncharacterized protein K0063H06.36 n=1 Tax=Oryza sativa subsp. indica TaxID=39946 RepID=C8TF25_ORYSI|nr:hypothetical protein [Oryza sativa Indica Group]
MVQIGLKANRTAAEAAAWLGHGTRPPHRPWHTVARAATGGTGWWHVPARGETTANGDDGR